MGRRVDGSMLPVTYHIISTSTATVGPDPLDLGLLVVLLIGISYLTYELVERKTTTRRRLTPPTLIVTIALIGLVVSFVIIPTIYSTPMSPQIATVVIPLGAGTSNSTSGFFVPSTIVVVIGINYTVAWGNNDNTVHSAHDDLGRFFSGDIPPGTTNYFNFSRTGNYTYHCNQHSWMAGLVVVRNR